jgi:ABC-2 type transport system permease protein
VTALLFGLSGYEVLFAAFRGLVMLLAAALLGAHVAWLQIGASVPILALVVAAHLPFAIVTAAMVLAFRSRGPLPQLVLIVSGFLGGVYYPTTVVPGWIKSIADFVPLAYGLRALRAVLLEGNSILTVWRDVAVLAAWSAVALAASAVAFRAALRYARRVGNLAQY